jgi:hypothetical protein
MEASGPVPYGQGTLGRYVVVTDDKKNNTSKIKHRVPHVMGVPLRFFPSRQGTQKKKIHSRLKSKAEMAKRRKESIVESLLDTLVGLARK